MRWKVLILALISLVVFSYPLFDVKAGWWNPIEIAFRNKYVAIQFDYMDENYQVLGVSAGFYSDAVNIFATGFISGDIINEGVDFENISTPVPISAALKLGNFLVAALRVMGSYSSEDGFSLNDGPIPIAVGLGGKSRRGLTSSAGAIYYLTHDFARIEDGEFKTAEEFDFKNGYVGIYAKSVGFKSEFMMDIGVDLHIIDVLGEGEGTLESEEFNPLDYLYARVSLSNGGFLIGGDYFFSTYYSIFAGLDFNVLKIWVETEKYGEKELFDNYTVSAQVSF